jgi:hypothetical protein
MKATFVSVWDNGDNTFRSNCEFNPETKEVTDVESVDVEGIDLYYVDKEYIELPDGTEVFDFTLDGVEYVDGQKDE